MFNPFILEDQNLDSEIITVYRHLSTLSPEDKEYQQTLDQLSKLYKLKHDLAELNLKAQKDHAAHQLACDQNAWSEEQDQRPFFARVEPNTVLTVAGSLLTALIVVKYEQTGVISSKALSFLRKF